MGRLLEQIAVATIGDDHDGVGVVERSFLVRPAIEVIFDPHLLGDVRIIEHHFDELDRPGIVVNSVSDRPVTLLPRDEDNLFSSPPATRWDAIAKNDSRKRLPRQEPDRNRITRPPSEVLGIHKSTLQPAT